MPTKETMLGRVLSRSAPVVIQAPTTRVVDILRKPFDDKHAELGGAPGAALDSARIVERSGAGWRVRYQNGTIYQRADGGCSWVAGLIGERYEAMGAGNSWLGLPISDETPMSEDGRASRFEHGAIYFWPDTGCIEINDVVVHYTGLYCFGETDWDQSSSADEPYAIVGVVAPSAAGTTRTQVYQDVDSGDSRPDVVEVYHGQPEGLILSVVLMENDFGDPDKYKDQVTAAVAAGATLLTAAIGVVGTPFLAGVAGPLLVGAVPEISEALNEVLGTGDDRIATSVLHLTAKQMILLAARTAPADQWGIGWKAETELMSGQGASYKVYFNLSPA